jgi:hypothetical protein
MPDIVLAQGDSATIASSSVRRTLLLKENALPEGSLVELSLEWSPLSIPGIGIIPLPKIVANGTNWLFQQGHLKIPVWPGDHLPASSSGQMTSIRWVKLPPASNLVLDAVESISGAIGTTTEAGASEAVTEILGPDLLPYALVIGAAIAGFLIWQYLDHWSLVHHVVQASGQIAKSTVQTLASPLVVGLAVAIPMAILFSRR